MDPLGKGRLCTMALGKSAGELDFNNRDADLGMGRGDRNSVDGMDARKTPPAIQGKAGSQGGAVRSVWV